MNDETKWWLFGSLCLAIVIGGPTSCVMHENAQKARSIESGADPLKVACAFDGSGNSARCLAALQQEPPNE